MTVRVTKRSFWGGVGVALVLVLVASVILGGCSGRTTAQDAESYQLAQGTGSIVQNQPVPNLGGYSLERDLLSQLILLRNEEIATYTYHWEYGTLVEICPSMGFPFPYATQLTAPEVYYTQGATIPQSEPNTLYSPPSADASWVLCVRNGVMIPEYQEDRVFAVPYRLKADRILEPVDGSEGESSINMKLNKERGNTSTAPLTDPGATAPTEPALDAPSLDAPSNP